MSVRTTAAGAVALVFLTCLTAPVSACDERYIKKCEKASAAAAAAAAAEPAAPAAGRKAGRVHMLASRHVRHIRFVKRVRAPAFATRGRTLTSAESRMTTLQPESALARRFRGFIDPTPMAQNAFEAMRKPHAAALNLEPPVLLPAEATPVVAQAPVAPQPPTPVAAAPKQDRVAPQPAMELASAESKPVKLPDPAPASPKPARVAAADAAPAAQAFLTAASPQQPDQPQPTGFPVHQLVIALCGALGVAGALRFVVGA